MCLIFSLALYFYLTVVEALYSLSTLGPKLLSYNAAVFQWISYTQEHTCINTFAGKSNVNDTVGNNNVIFKENMSTLKAIKGKCRQWSGNGAIRKKLPHLKPR